MEITYETLDNKVIVKASGELNILNAGELEQTSLYAIKHNSFPLVMDFTSLSYISSSGLSAIIHISKEIRDMKRKMSITMQNGAVCEVFKKTGLFSIFDIRII